MQTLPDEIGDCPYILQMDLSYMPSLRSLPASIGKLGYLLELNMPGASNFTRLPDSLATMGSLLRISASGCAMTSLPPSFFELPALYSVDLSDNQLTSVPAGFQRLFWTSGGPLQSAYLGGNPFTKTMTVAQISAATNTTCVLDSYFTKLACGVSCRSIPGSSTLSAQIGVNGSIWATVSPSQLYPPLSNCTWLIQAPPGRRVRVQFPLFDLEPISNIQVGLRDLLAVLAIV